MRAPCPLRAQHDSGPRPGVARGNKTLGPKRPKGWTLDWTLTIGWRTSENLLGPWGLGPWAWPPWALGIGAESPGRPGLLPAAGQNFGRSTSEQTEHHPVHRQAPERTPFPFSPIDHCC